MPSASDRLPRLKLNPSTKELNELYSPTVYELAFARERARQNAHGLAQHVVDALKAIPAGEQIMSFGFDKIKKTSTAI